MSLKRNNRIRVLIICGRLQLFVCSISVLWTTRCFSNIFISKILFKYFKITLVTSNKVTINSCSTLLEIHNTFVLLLSYFVQKLQRKGIELIENEHKRSTVQSQLYVDLMDLKLCDFDTSVVSYISLISFLTERTRSI